MQNESVVQSNSDNFSFYISNIFKIVFIFTALNLFISRSWVGEDAFIFFKYVDNFVNGNGLVFNLNERVEGFTAPLWVLVLSFFRYILKVELRPLAIIIGLVFSTIASGIFLYYSSKSKYFFPLAFVLMISNSAFNDFATSGFETSLTYLLLILVLIAVDLSYIEKKPMIAATLISLLVLNRPESFLILLYFISKLFYKSVKYKNWYIFKNFLIAPVLLIGGYQIFRMGYYASMLPNTFYAKKGGTFYIAQGFNYLRDFAVSYPLTTLIMLCCIVFALMHKRLRTPVGDYLVIFSLLCMYVLYAGGDYMHGRSLLMAFIVGIFIVSKVSNFLQTKFSNNSFAMRAGLLVIAVVLLRLLLLQTPITKSAGKQINNIADERARFGYGYTRGNFINYIQLPITFELGWAERGYYYRELSTKLNMPISVVNTNIGYFGYAAGDLVNVMGGVLIDPYIARQPVMDRGKIGHENDPHWDYIYSRKPTFAYTPFKIWNENAHFKWNDSKFAYAITDDSNDSFVPIFDLSNAQFLDNYSKLIGTDIKSSIDTKQREFLSNLSKEHLNKYGFSVEDYLEFLKKHWYPYATTEDRDLFDTKIMTLGLYTYTNDTSLGYYDERLDRVTKPLSMSLFVDNIVFTLKNH